MTHLPPRYGSAPLRCETNRLYLRRPSASESTFRADTLACHPPSPVHSELSYIIPCCSPYDIDIHAEGVRGAVKKGCLYATRFPLLPGMVCILTIGVRPVSCTPLIILC